ncbi:MAG: Flp pilus assembly protein CpaB [Candidatus Omnitrophota bacterium]|nr:Flp pilus assembly protein CpaB [Candidatus Omnitrophota bacterium]
MEKNKIRVLIIAGVMALLAAVLMFLYLQQEKAKIESDKPVMPAAEEVSILQATKDISRGQIVEKNAVVFKKIPVNFIQPGAISNLDAAVGKIALVDILSGEQITTTKLANPATSLTASSSASTLSMMTPPGKRAITISIEPLMAVGGMVRPGDYVDVLANFPLPQEVGGKQTVQLVTVTLFQNVLILAVGTQIRGPTSRGAKQDTTVSPEQNTITVALSPQEAELISFAQEQGKLRLILRPPLDTQTQALPPATAEALWQHILSTQGLQMQMSTEESQPVSVEKKPSSSVEVYRGGKR